MYFFVAAGKISGQFTTEEFGVGSRDDYMHFATKHTVHEQMPSIHVLDLIHKQVVELAVKLVEDFKYVVELGGLYTLQSLIIEVHIAIFNSGSFQRLET